MDLSSNANFFWLLRSGAFANIYFIQSICYSVLYWVDSPPNFLRVWKTRSLRSSAIFLVYLTLGGFDTEHSLVSFLLGQLVVDFDDLNHV